MPRMTPHHAGGSAESISIKIQFSDLLATRTWNDEFNKHASHLDAISASPTHAARIEIFTYSASPVTSHNIARIEADDATRRGYARLMSSLEKFIRACHNLRFLTIHSAVFERPVAASIQQLGHLEGLEMRAAAIAWDASYGPLNVQKVHMSCGESKGMDAVHHFKHLSIQRIHSLRLEDARLGRTLDYLVQESSPRGLQGLVDLQVEITSNKVAEKFIQFLERCPKLQNLAITDSRTQKAPNPLPALSPGAVPRLAAFSGPSDIARHIIASPRPIQQLTLESRIETTEDALGVLFALQNARRPLPAVSLLQVFSMENLKKTIDLVRPHLGKVNGLKIRFKANAEVPVPDKAFTGTLPANVKWAEDIRGYWMCEILNERRSRPALL